MEWKAALLISLVLVMLAFSLAVSFRKNLNFYAQLKYFAPAALFSGIIFILWLRRFAEIGIWGYNPEFFLGITLLNLPLEEWLFLLLLSFGSAVLYQWVKTRFAPATHPNRWVALSLLLLVGFALQAYFGRNKLYPFFTFFLLSIYFGYTFFRNRFKKHYSAFYITYLLAAIPFAVLKIIFNALPAIHYNAEHLLGISLFGMPVEDFGYLFLLMLINLTIFEYLRERRFY